MNVIRIFDIQKVFYWCWLFFIFMQNKGQYEIQVKLITITYRTKWLLVTQVWGKNHGIYECIKIWCVFELIRTRLLIAYLLRDLWDAIFMVYLSFQRYNSVNFFSTVYPMLQSLLMPHGMCRIYACCSVVLSLHLLHWRWSLGDPIAMQMDVVREVPLCDAVSSQLSGWSGLEL